MTLPTYTLRPSVRATLNTFLIHHNPFYLLSALSMLAGCYALNSALAVRTGEIWKLLGLIAALNAYEFLLIGLGLYLIQARRIIRDGRTLLLLEAVFLTDLTFLNAQAGSVSFGAGLLVSLALISLMALKVTVILRILWVRLPIRLLGMVLLSLATLQLMPSVFAWYDHHGGVTWRHLYAGWWIAGALIGLLGTTRIAFEPDSVPVRRVMRAIFLHLPVVSMVAHLGMLHWVYRVPFAGNDLSPLLLGVTVLLTRSPVGLMHELRALRVLMPLAAVLLAARDSTAISTRNIPVTTNELTLAAAYATVAYCFFRKRFAPLMAGGAGLAGLALFGPSLQQMINFLAICWRRVAAGIRMLIPSNAMEWGFVAVASSFAFLAIGAAVSLKKHEPMEAPEQLTTDN